MTSVLEGAHTLGCFHQGTWNYFSSLLTIFLWIVISPGISLPASILRDKRCFYVVAAWFSLWVTVTAVSGSACWQRWLLLWERHGRLFAERESKSVCGLRNDARGKGCRGKWAVACSPLVLGAATICSSNLCFPLAISSAESCVRNRAFTQEATDIEPLVDTTCSRGLGHGASPALKVPPPSRDFRSDYWRILSIPFISAV